MITNFWWLNFRSFKNFFEKITVTLKSYIDLKTMQLLQKLLLYHEILHVKSADHDLSRSFFRSWKKVTRSRDMSFYNTSKRVKHPVKPFYLTRGFVTSHGCHWLYLGSVGSFLSVSDIWTWDLMSSCIMHGEI